MRKHEIVSAVIALATPLVCCGGNHMLSNNSGNTKTDKERESLTNSKQNESNISGEEACNDKETLWNKMVGEGREGQIQREVYLPEEQFMAAEDEIGGKKENGVSITIYWKNKLIESGEPSLWANREQVGERDAILRIFDVRNGTPQLLSVYYYVQREEESIIGIVFTLKKGKKVVKCGHAVVQLGDEEKVVLNNIVENSGVLGQVLQYTGEVLMYNKSSRSVLVEGVKNKGDYFWAVRNGINDSDALYPIIEYFEKKLRLVELLSQEETGRDEQ